MAITVTHKPYLLQGSKNPVEFRIQTDSYEQFPATLLSLTLTFADILAINDSITFGFDGHTVTFTVKSSPDDSGTQITAPGALSLDEWLDVVVVDLEKNYLLFTYYNVTKLLPEKIRLISRNPGSYNNVDFSYSSSVSITESNISAIDAVYAPNFSFKYDVYQSIDSAPVASGFKIPDQNSSAWFDFSEIIDDMLHEYERPDKGLVFQTLTPITKYSIIFTEVYGSPVEFHALKMGSDSDLFAIKGGFNHLDFPAKRDLINQLNWLLPGEPYNRQVTPDQDVFLSYIHKDLLDGTVASADFNLQVTVLYDDGTTPTYILPTDYTVNSKFEIAVFNVGYNVLGVGDLDPLKTVLHYRIALILPPPDATVVASNVTFIITEKSRIDKAFHYRNSFGVYESMQLYGQQAMGIELSFDEINKILPYNYSETDFQRDHTEHEITHQYTVSSGQFPTIEALKGAIDLLLSDDVFFYDSDDRPVKILINKGKVKIMTDDSGFKAFQFSYSLAFTDKNYS